MAKPAPEYELVLMLDPEVPDERRDQIAVDARRHIEDGGSLKQERTWGLRKMAYEIKRRTEADYRFFRFEKGDSVLDQLNHNLKITDGVLRYRIFNVNPSAPVIDPPPPASLAASAPPRSGARRRDDDQPQRGPEAEAPAEPAPTPAAAAPPEGAEAPPAPSVPEGEQEAPVAETGTAPQPDEAAPAPEAPQADEAAPEAEAPPAGEPAPGPDDEQQA